MVQRTPDATAPPRVLARGWKRLPCADLIGRMQRRSMLHPQALTAMHVLAGRSNGAVIEIGAYVGGGTTVLAKAMIEAGSAAPMITVEYGGRHDNPYLPSEDILADLRSTLRSEGVLERVTIIEGWSNAPETIDRVRATLAGEKVGLVVIDADGQVGRDFDLYREFLADDAYMICDDYSMTDDNIKSAPVRDWVQSACRSGLFEDLGVLPYGTWIGRYRGGRLGRGSHPRIAPGLRAKWAILALPGASTALSIRNRLRQRAWLAKRGP